jgi:asparagine synthase (glutamine-hydrolysing)
MSAIYGLINLDNTPVSEVTLATMRSALQEWGPDGGAEWRVDSAGLGSLIRFATPEARNEQMPLRSTRGFVLTATARLDNRDDLFRELHISPPERPNMPDGQLVLRAYETWGEDAPQHLLGDWSLAAWHPQSKRLFIARDQLGNTSLYYFQDTRRFMFASSRKALHALGIPRRLNEWFLACGLVSWSAHDGPQTIELDLHRLPPAHTLRLEGATCSVRQYWRLEDTSELRLRSSEDYAEGLLAIYDQAIRDRLRSSGGIGLFLSGGLDSGSMAVLAARALREKGARLTAYTSAPAYDVGHASERRAIGDEVPLARSVASFAGNIDLHEIRAREVTPIQGMRRNLKIHEEPSHAASNSFWIHEVLAAGRQHGLGTMLNGQGGNATISWNGRSRARTLSALLRARLWSRAVQVLIYPHLPLPVIRRLRLALHPGELDWSRTAIHPEFARRIGLSSEYIRHSGDATKREDWYPPVQERYAIIRPGASFVGSIWAEKGAAYGLDIRDATLDKRVVEFVIATPDREFVGPDGYNRWLIRAAMQGLLPDEVRLNRRHGLQAADIGHRLVASAPEVEQALTEIEGSELARQYLALQRMREVWTLIQRQIDYDSTHQAMTILTRGILAGLFLAAFEGDN